MLATGTYMFGLAIDETSAHVTAPDANRGGVILRVSKQGGTPQVLAEGVGPARTTLDATRVFLVAEFSSS